MEPISPDGKRSLGLGTRENLALSLPRFSPSRFSLFRGAISSAIDSVKSWFGGERAKGQGVLRPPLFRAERAPFCAAPLARSGPP